MEKKTALYERHLHAGGKMVPFAGFLLPVQYADGILSEHLAVRRHAGLFDVSHMAEARLRGAGALATLQRLCTNNIETLVPGRVRYSPLCNDEGGVVDDILVYCVKREDYLLVLNAANHDKDVEWIRANLAEQTEFADVSDAYAQLALQGPRALSIMEALCDRQDIPTKPYTFTWHAKVADVPCILSRTGYTGEDGFELYTAPQDAPLLWDHLAEGGAKPCGLGARDTLRLEASMPLYGHELTDTITPLEAGLGAFVKMEKPDFIGRDALLRAGEPKRRRVGLRITGRGIAREECGVYRGEELIGRTTSGTLAPFLHQAVAMALVDAAHVQVGAQVTVDIRGRRVEAEIVPLPFYKRAK